MSCCAFGKQSLNSSWPLAIFWPIFPIWLNKSTLLGQIYCTFPMRKPLIVYCNVPAFKECWPISYHYFKLWIKWALIKITSLIIWDALYTARRPRTDVLYWLLVKMWCWICLLGNCILKWVGWNNCGVLLKCFKQQSNQSANAPSAKMF